MRTSGFLLIPLVSAALAACSTGTGQIAGGATTAGGLAALNKVTHEDLAAAEADAAAHNDLVAMPCYTYIDTSLLPSLPGGEGNTAVKGAFSAFQKARDSALVLQTGVPAQFQLACGPLLMDVQNSILRLAAIVAGTAATSGVIGLVP